MERIDLSIKRWIKWVVILLGLRRPRAIQWASFLSLNPLIHRIVTTLLQRIGKLTNMTNEMSNLLSSGLLYSAISGNRNFPSDYAIIYIWSSYIIELNPPSHSQILPTPNFSKYFKLNYYNSPRLYQLYNNKNYLIFPLVFGQILSNYLTPTKYKLNQRYLSSFIKSKILNPIWINYSLGISQHSLKWIGLFKSYAIHNLAMMLIIGVISFKQRMLDHYYELKHKIYEANNFVLLKDVIINYLAYTFHYANSIVNFVYLPNLISIFLISLTSSSVKFITNSSHTKSYFKLYIKAIGFISGVITLFINSMDLVPDIYYKLTNYDLDTINIHESGNIRRIQDSLINNVNTYLIKLIVLQKWRILKENHPLFRKFRLKTWNRAENLIFCYGIFKLMNLNDFLKSTNGKNYGLTDNMLIKLVDRIM